MNEVRRELDRLRRGWRTTRGHGFVNRLHLALLVAMLALAIGHRLFGPWALLEALEADGILFYAVWVVAIALAALLLQPLLHLVVPRLLWVSPTRLAEDLEDRMEWRDAVSTALALPAGDSHRTRVEAFLLAQSAGRLRAVSPRRLWARGRARPWVRRVLAVLFVAILLLPGVMGQPFGRGAGRGEETFTGTQPETRPTERLPVDEWLLTHVHAPLPAEPLLPEPVPPEPVPPEPVPPEAGEEDR